MSANVFSPKSPLKSVFNLFLVVGIFLLASCVEAEPPAPEEPTPPARVCATVEEPNLPERNDFRDEVPLPFLSDAFDMNDPALDMRLSGIGAITYENGSPFCTASLVGRGNFAVTAGHCFTRKTDVGGWKDKEMPLFHKRWRYDDIPYYFYSTACNQYIRITGIMVGTKRTSIRAGDDYAILRLDEKACDKAVPFEMARLSADEIQWLADNETPLISLAVFHPEYKDIPEPYRSEMGEAADRPAPWGNVCSLSADGKVQWGNEGPASLSVFGCDTIPGASGGPLLVSTDGGRSYRMIGLLKGGAGTTWTLYTYIHSGFASDLDEMFAAWRFTS